MILTRANDPEGHGADTADMGHCTLKRVEDAFARIFPRVRRGRESEPSVRTHDGDSVGGDVIHGPCMRN